MQRKSLGDILRSGERDRLAAAWSTTKAADDLKPIPRGEYICRIINGELFNAQTGTPGFKITLEVRDGEYARRRVWHDVWLSEAALAMARRDLTKLGIERIEQLERPLPDGIVVRAQIVLRHNDDGIEYNAVRRFDVVAVEPPSPEPFAPGEHEDDDTEARSNDERPVPF